MSWVPILICIFFSFYTNTISYKGRSVKPPEQVSRESFSWDWVAKLMGIYTNVSNSGCYNASNFGLYKWSNSGYTKWSNLLRKYLTVNDLPGAGRSRRATAWQSTTYETKVVQKNIFGEFVFKMLIWHYLIFPSEMTLYNPMMPIIIITSINLKMF